MVSMGRISPEQLPISWPFPGWQVVLAAELQQALSILINPLGAEHAKAFGQELWLAPTLMFAKDKHELFVSE